MALPPHGATLSVEQYRALESETDFQTWVINTARGFGWRVTHFRPAKTGRQRRNKRGQLVDVWVTALQGDKGFPDLVLARDGVSLHPELKSQDGNLDDDQKAWRDALGESWRLWRPADRDEIERELGRPRL